MIACFLSNISVKYYKNLSMLSRVIAKNVGDVFFETQCIFDFYFCLIFVISVSFCIGLPYFVKIEQPLAEL